MDCAAEFERGDWVELHTGGADQGATRTAYLEALAWAEEFHRKASSA